jgi:hypothetical protein
METIPAGADLGIAVELVYDGLSLGGNGSRDGVAAMVKVDSRVRIVGAKPVANASAVRRLTGLGSLFERAKTIGVSNVGW